MQTFNPYKCNGRHLLLFKYRDSATRYLLTHFIYNLGIEGHAIIRVLELDAIQLLLVRERHLEKSIPRVVYIIISCKWFLELLMEQQCHKEQGRDRNL